MVGQSLFEEPIKMFFKSSNLNTKCKMKKKSYLLTRVICNPTICFSTLAFVHIHIFLFLSFLYSRFISLFYLFLAFAKMFSKFYDWSLLWGFSLVSCSSLLAGFPMWVKQHTRLNTTRSSLACAAWTGSRAFSYISKTHVTVSSMRASMMIWWWLYANIFVILLNVFLLVFTSFLCLSFLMLLRFLSLV